MNILFDDFARVELDEAAAYYEFESPGLGLRFHEEVRKAVERIREHPGAWARERGDQDHNRAGASLRNGAPTRT